MKFLFDNMLGVCNKRNVTYEKQVCKREDNLLQKTFFFYNMVHIGAPNMDAHFYGYFYNCKSNVKFCGNLMSFLVGKVSLILLSFLLYENFFFACTSSMYFLLYHYPPLGLHLHPIVWHGSNASNSITYSKHTHWSLFMSRLGA